MNVVGHALWMREWAPALVEYVHSPLGLWQAVKHFRDLPFAVACFQDQLANIDDSYHAVTIKDQQIRVSPIEAMIMMRFHPYTYAATAIGGRPGKPSFLALVTQVVKLHSQLSTAAFDALLGDLLHPILECQRQRIVDWYAREVFALKVGCNFERMMSQRMQEIESLIRVRRHRQEEASSLPTILEGVRVGRRNLVSRIR